MSIQETPNIEFIVLSSGREVTIVNPDFAMLKTERDMIEAKYEFAARVIDIETNIEMAKLSRNFSGKSFDPLWLAKAQKALAYAKLNQQTIDQLLVMFRAERKDQKEREFARVFVDVSRTILNTEEFDSIRRIAELADRSGPIVELKKRLVRISGAS